jgi:hypothetical protein
VNENAGRTRQREHAPASQRTIVIVFALIEFLLLAACVSWILARR